MTRACPDYGSDAFGQLEARAYNAGYDTGHAGKAMAYTQLATTCPNAYARGYWDGVHALESEHEDHARP